MNQIKLHKLIKLIKYFNASEYTSYQIHMNLNTNVLTDDKEYTISWYDYNIDLTFERKIKTNNTLDELTEIITNDLHKQTNSKKKLNKLLKEIKNAVDESNKTT